MLVREIGGEARGVTDELSDSQMVWPLNGATVFRNHGQFAAPSRVKTTCRRRADDAAAAATVAAVSQIYETFRLMLLLLWISTAPQQQQRHEAINQEENFDVLEHGQNGICCSSTSIITVDVAVRVGLCAALSAAPRQQQQQPPPALTQWQKTNDPSRSTARPFFNWPRIVHRSKALEQWIGWM